MIYLDRRVHASGPRTARLAVIGMSPQKWELADRKPFTGPSGRILDDALHYAKSSRAATFVTNMCEFFIDDNDLASVPKEVMDCERDRVFHELDSIRPNCLLILGGDTLFYLTGKSGITKWRGSIFELTTPSGRIQKCVAAMHPAAFIRGQWKWLPLFKYIDVPRAVAQSSYSEMNLTRRRAIVGPSFRDAVNYLMMALTQPQVAIDYEGREHISCLGLGWNISEAMCIPLSRVGNSSYWSVTEETTIWKLWCELLQSSAVMKIAQNASYEIIKSWLYGIYPNNVLDTMHMHHCLYPDWGGVNDEWSKRKRDIDNPGHGLAMISSQYTDQPFYKDEGRHWRPEFGEDVFWNYNALDVMVTFEDFAKMRSELQALGLWEVYLQQYAALLPHTLRMEWYGIAFDCDARDVAREVTHRQLVELGDALAARIGKRVITKVERKGAKPKANELNLASPKQMRDFLEARKYKLPLHRKTGKPTADKDTLTALAIRHKDDDLFRILEMKQLQDFENDILNQKLDAEGRSHSHYKIGGTNGTRLSSTESILGSGTNHQNLPRTGIARTLYLPD